MTCLEVKELIYLFMDNELDSRGTLDAQRHLDECGSCSRLLNNLTEQDRILRQAAQAEPVDTRQLRERIIGEIKSRPRHRLRPFFRSERVRLGFATAASIAALIGFVGVLIVQSNNTAVFADAVSDHLDHCKFDVLAAGAGSQDPAFLKEAAEEYCSGKAVPDLSKYGFGTFYGRVCELAGDVYLHLVYFDDKKEPLSVFISSHGAHVITDSINIVGRDGFTIATVSSSGVMVVVLSRHDEQWTRTMTAAIATELKQGKGKSFSSAPGVVYRADIDLVLFGEFNTRGYASHAPLVAEAGV